MIQSCGKCAGMTPVASNSCADKFGNCKELAKTMCYNSKIKSACCISCGLGKLPSYSSRKTSFLIFQRDTPFIPPKFLIPYPPLAE